MFNSLDGLMEIFTISIRGFIGAMREYISVFFYQDWLFGLSPGWLFLGFVVLSFIIGWVRSKI